MSTIRTGWRSAAALGAVAIGISATGTLLVTPAAAFCFGLGCGLHLHAGLAALLARPQVTRSVAVPMNQPVARLHLRQNVASTRTVSADSKVLRSVPSRSLTVGSAAAKTLRTNLSVGKNNHSAPMKAEELKVPAPLTDVSAGGPSFAGPGLTVPAFPSMPGVPSGGGNTGFGGGQGGGAGQFTTANVPPNGSSGGASTRPPAGGAAAPQTTTGATTLTAVTACVTRAGSCPMERDIGTACQCKDTQGHVYDGIVQ